MNITNSYIANYISSLDSEKDYDYNIYYFILSVLLGWRSIYEKIKLNDGEQRQLIDNIFKQSLTSSTVLYFVGIAEFLTNVIPLICQSQLKKLLKLTDKWARNNEIAIWY